MIVHCDGHPVTGQHVTVLDHAVVELPWHSEHTVLSVDTHDVLDHLTLRTSTPGDLATSDATAPDGAAVIAAWAAHSPTVRGRSGYLTAPNTVRAYRIRPGSASSSTPPACWAKSLPLFAT